METSLPAGVPQRRLSRLYNDTKRSSSFVKGPVQPSAEGDPEIKALHRKLRIQKDRFVSWGLEWSDPGQHRQAAEVLIDSSLSEAGLSEVVGSILSTIRDILAEAEPLWNSSRELAGEGVPLDKPRPGEKIRLVVWDKNRFEDLVRDLTSSVDTLYDLSRTRSSYARTSPAVRERERLLEQQVSAAAGYNDSDDYANQRPFVTSRLQTPKQIDPATLTSLRSMEAVPMTEQAAHADTAREIVFMSKDAFADLALQSTARPQNMPLLLEYAPFDPIFASTGILPDMNRFEKLSAVLQAKPQLSSDSWIGLPRLLGYFEDMDHSRFGLVYQFPPTFNPVTFEHLTHNPLYNMCSLADLLARPDFEPRLEAKFRLAANLASTIFDMHARGITHGCLEDTNVSFCNAVGTDPEVSGINQGEVDIRRPLISSFDPFCDNASPELTAAPEAPKRSLHHALFKHPLDPRRMAQSPLAAKAESKAFDLYSLAMMLLSIGLWSKLDNLVSDPATSPAIPDSLLDQLAVRCGTLYMKAVKACWTAVDDEMAGLLTGEKLAARVQVKVSRYLEACCIVDRVSSLEERLGDDMGDRAEETRASQKVTVSPVVHAGPSQTSDSEKGQVLFTSSTASIEAQATSEGQDLAASAKPSRPKKRLFPHVSLSPEAVTLWNTRLMSDVNHALQSFYRRHPESVEISLEPVGESPHKMKPTVLVVCTSVNKVRSILKKKLGDLLDGRGEIGLKVCRGRIVRSRNHGDRTVRRSNATGEEDSGDDGLVEAGAANPDYQERPRNGASIGAWIGDRHLPPVSFGGMIVVDDKPFGMTVHHMLDDMPDNMSLRNQAQAAATVATPTAANTALKEEETIPRSMARTQALPDLAAWYAEKYQVPTSAADSSDPDDSGSDTEDFSCQFSDSDLGDTATESALTSDISEEEADGKDQQHDGFEPGDIPGIELGCGDGYIVTQPALDDVEEGFYPSSETQDEDHLDTFTLGDLYASSGIRRREDSGMVHEVDWALFRFRSERTPDGNSIPSTLHHDETKDDGGDIGAATAAADAQIDEHGSHKMTMQPALVIPCASLAGLEVQCMARSSGLQTGVILPVVTSIKIYGRTTVSHSYQVSGTPHAYRSEDSHGYPMPLGIPGDSGGWIVDRHTGGLCGHVLAWSRRKKVAYICPMDVLLQDVAEVLGAREIRLPGSLVPIITVATGKRASSMSILTVGSTARMSSMRISSALSDVSDLSEEGEVREYPPVSDLTAKNSLGQNFNRRWGLRGSSNSRGRQIHSASAAVQPEERSLGRVGMDGENEHDNDDDNDDDNLGDLGGVGLYEKARHSQQKPELAEDIRRM